MYTTATAAQVARSCAGGTNSTVAATNTTSTPRTASCSRTPSPACPSRMAATSGPRGASAAAGGATGADTQTSGMIGCVEIAPRPTDNP